MRIVLFPIRIKIKYCNWKRRIDKQHEMAKRYAIKDIEGVKCLNASVIKFSDLLESISDQNIEFPEDEISRFIFVFKDPESEDYIRDIDDQIICCNRVNGCRLDKLDIQITSYDKEDSDDEEDESNNEGNNEEEEESK